MADVADDQGSDLGDILDVNVGEGRVECIWLLQDAALDHSDDVDVLHVVHWLQNGERHSRHQHHPFDSQLTLVVEQRFELGMGDRELHEVGYTGTASGCNDTMPHLRLAVVHGWPNVDDDSCPIHGSGEVVGVK